MKNDIFMEYENLFVGEIGALPITILANEQV